MKGLLIKDLMAIKKNGRSLFVAIAIFVMTSFMFENAYFMTGMIVVLSTMLVINTFSYDATAKWDRYVLALPLSRNDVVKSKYMASLILSGMGLGLTILIGMAQKLAGASKGYGEILLEGYTFFAAAICFLCILIPLIFKFGVEKSRVLLMVVYFIPMMAILFFTNSGLLGSDSSLLHTILLVSPILLVVFLLISYWGSCAIYSKKDI